jgi:hypothetical protein
MTECQLILNIDGLYECPDCEWVHKHKADKPPRRNCPNAPDINTPEHRETIKQRMLAEIAPTAAIITQLDQCLTPCKEFNGQTCTYRGSACKKWPRWKEFLALTTAPCRHYG